MTENDLELYQNRYEIYMTMDLPRTGKIAISFLAIWDKIFASLTTINVLI